MITDLFLDACNPQVELKKKMEMGIQMLSLQVLGNLELPVRQHCRGGYGDGGAKESYAGRIEPS